MDTLVKNQDWLKNSTYKRENIEEYKFDESEKPQCSEILRSDSDSSDSILSKVRNKSRRKYKKIRKRKIVKHYLKCLPTISDENCEFRKYVFLEHMPKEDRSKSFFIDLKGNNQISRYGCIYEKHIPKYQSKSDRKTLKSIVSERYYEKLKSLKSYDSNLSIEKRLCDSHCKCHQPFIPVSFDVENHGPKVTKEIEDLSMSQRAILTDTINKDPHNIDAWIRLVNLQSESNGSEYSKISTNSFITEKKLMIVEKALSKNQSNLQMHLMRMTFGAEVWSPEKLQKEWSQLIFVHNTNISVWRFYIEQMSRQIIGFSVEKVINIYNKCFNIFFNIMSGRMKVKTVDVESIYDLCDLFADFCEYLAQSGYSERATSSWQAMIEYNFFSPADLKPKSSGNLLDDPMLRSFQEFWQSSRPIFGHENARGWSEFSKDPTNTFPNCPSNVQGQLQQEVSAAEMAFINGNDNETELWLKLEQVRLQSWWLSDSSFASDHEDADRCVPFHLVQPVLISLHDPQNLHGDHMSSDIAAKAKRRLLLLFFDYLNVSNCRLSLDNELSVSRLRWHQLKPMGSIDKIVTPLVPIRNLSHHFIQCCIDQLSRVLADDERQMVSILHLSYTVQISLAGCQSWKQALSTVKNTAKSILTVSPGNTLLWMTYADLLISMLDHDMFARSNKGRPAILNEISKVIQPLVQQVTSCSLPLCDKLHIMSLSIDLIIRKYPLECSDAVLGNIIAALCPSAHILAALHLIPPPADQSVANLVQTFTQVVNVTNSPFDPVVVTHWYQAVYCQILSQLLLLDVKKFQEWMLDECLLTITSTGSSCLWSQQFLYQLSQLLESVTSFISWFYRSKGRNEGAILRVLLTPITHVLTQIQSGIKKPILEMVLSPRLVQNCIGNSSISGQRFKLRNFLWTLVGSFETEDESKFHHNCQASSLLLLGMEIDRLDTLASTDVDTSVGVFSGRTDRVRSTFNRLTNLRCMHWKYRLAMWHSLLTLESLQKTNKREETTKGVFYRAITEMPGQKSLYLAIVSLVPSMLEEATLLMKNNHVRLAAPLEEVKLLMRIRQSKLEKSEII